ncbi:MAG TPA: 50S ribosomal protein L3 [Candidatus Cloacimonadota bacterium]|nr:50S ribosomal protein L3 [Candidatus Cloacimonadota bacterium]HOQ80717.1 50S ribosomal protein L3 [Candidatus Cloacimonadota bacterium]HPK41061.1 50S ribosomal protein L3 [Candidatus Cloacimonadota bacterium]
MLGLIGKKIAMTQIFDKDGKVVPVTVLEVGPCVVVQKKTTDKDGYNAIQLGFEEIVERKVKKPVLGHFKKHNSKAYRYLREFRIDHIEDFSEGQALDLNIFQENEIVKVIGTSKGRGFAGVMKRHNFSGFEMGHGVHESFRGGGSIGQCATPARVLKGRKMAGHFGVDRVTVKNLKIVKLDKERNLVMIKGAVPGHRNSLIYLSK